MLIGDSVLAQLFLNEKLAEITSVAFCFRTLCICVSKLIKIKMKCLFHAIIIILNPLQN